MSETLGSGSSVDPAAEVQAAINELERNGGVRPTGDYSNIRFTEDGAIQHGNTYEVGDDGKASIIGREAYKEKHGLNAEADVTSGPVVETEPAADATESATADSDNNFDPSKRPGAIDTVSFPNKRPEKKRRQRTDEAVGKGLEPDMDAPQPVENKKGKEKISESDKQKKLIEDWARHEYNGDKEAAKQAQDAIQEYLIDAVKRGIITDDEAVAQIDRFWHLKEANKAERGKLLEDLGQRLQGRLDELNAGAGADDDELPPIRPVTAEEIDEEERSILDGFELSEKLQKDLDDARKAYVELSAKRREVNSPRHANALREAKEAYEHARNLAGREIARLMQEAGFEREAINKWGKRGAQLEIHELSNGIKDKRIGDFEDRRFKGFYEWWGRQSNREGLWGKLKGRLGKKAVSSVVAFGAGFGIARAVNPAILAGAAVGGTVGGVRRHFDRVSTIKEDAEQQARKAIEYGEQLIDSNEEALGVKDLTQLTDSQTSEIVSRNRKQLTKSVAIGAATGAAGAAARMVADNIFDGGNGGSSSGNEGPKVPGLEENGNGSGEPTVPGLGELPGTPSGDIVGPPDLGLPANFLDTMPWENAHKVFNSPKADELIRQSLDIYNNRYGRAFEWRNGKFFEGINRQIGESELRDYNTIMAELFYTNPDFQP